MYFFRTHFHENDSDENDQATSSPSLLPLNDWDRLLPSAHRNSWTYLLRRTVQGFEENQNESELEAERLSEEITGKLIVATYNEKEVAVVSAVGNTSKCQICLEKYSLGKLITQLLCKQMFCKDCIFT